MTVFGYAVSLTLLLQLAATAFLLGLYALTESMNEQKAGHLSDRNMLLLSAFLLQHNPAVTSLAKLAEMTDEELAKEITYYRPFGINLSRLLQTGLLPDLAYMGKPTLRDHAEMAISAPVVGLLMPIFAMSEYRVRIYRITHTVYRKNFVSKVMFMLCINLFMVLAVAELLLAHHPIVCGVLVAVPIVSILGYVATVAIQIMNQQKWKEYWTDRLLEIMAIAAHDKNHDLFNRALFLKNDVDSQPDMPIPGKLSLYTTVYSVVQVAILYLAKTMHLS